MKTLNLVFYPFPLLSGPRIGLRRITFDDAPVIFALRSSSRVMQYIDRPRAISIEDAKVLIGKIEESLVMQTGITWGIEDKNSRQLIGTIGFWRIEAQHFRAEIGYMMDERFQGNGLMSEAMKLMLAYGFNTMNLHSVEANVNPANQASIRLLEKHGFVKEAHFREDYFFNGRFIDTAIYSLLEGGTPA